MTAPLPATTTSPAMTTNEVFTCQLKCTDGSMCGRFFEDQKGLLFHQSTSAEHYATKTFSVASMGVTSVCPWCKTILSSTGACADHIRNAFVKRRCPAVNAVKMPVSVEMRTVLRPDCSKYCRDEKVYGVHCTVAHGKPSTGFMTTQKLQDGSLRTVAAPQAKKQAVQCQVPKEIQEQLDLQSKLLLKTDQTVCK